MECGKEAWVKNMAKCIVEFGWQGTEGDAIKDLTELDIIDMLSSRVGRDDRNMMMKLRGGTAAF